MSTQGPLCKVWDLTGWTSKGWVKDSVEELLKKHGDKWAFQLELAGENEINYDYKYELVKGRYDENSEQTIKDSMEMEKSGGLHFQCRVCLRGNRAHKTAVVRLFEGMHVSPTSTKSTKNFDYVMKEETRIDGPWTSENIEEEEDVFIDEEVKRIANELKPWQTSILKVLEEQSRDKIAVVLDKIGGIGKTTLTDVARYKKIAGIIPSLDTTKLMMECIFGQLTKNRKISKWIVDLPRATNEETIAQTYKAMETLKGGTAYDSRFTFREIITKRPSILVFTNKIPNLNYISKFRWDFFTVVNNELVSHDITQVEAMIREQNLQAMEIALERDLIKKEDKERLLAKIKAKRLENK